MKIYVDMLFINMKLETFSIEVNESTTLKKAKELILEVSYVYPEEQAWFSNNIPLKNQKIEWSNNSNYSIIVNNYWYNFKIKNMLGTIIDVTHLSSRDKISVIKYHIYEKVGIYPDSYKLLYNNKELKDYEYIGKYFIPDQSLINLVIKLNSGN